MKKFLSILLCALILAMSVNIASFSEEGGAGDPAGEIVKEEEETPADPPTEKPTDAPTEAPPEERSPAKAPAEEPTEPPTEAPTEKPTEAPTEKPTEAPTAAPTEAPTEAPTSAPTEKPTEAPSGTPTAAPTAAPTREPEASITIIKPSVSSLRIRRGQSSHVLFTDQNGKSIDPKLLKWTVGDPSVASASEDLVKGLKVGKTTLTAEYSGQTASVTVEVIPLYDEISCEPVSIFTNQTADIVVYGDGNIISDSGITVSVNDDSKDYIKVSGSKVSAVTAGGLIKGSVASFEGGITVSLDGRAALCDVEVLQAATGIEYGPVEISVGSEKSVSALYTVKPANSLDAAEEHTSSNASVLSVSGDTLKANAAGSADVTVTFRSGAKYTMKVTAVTGSKKLTIKKPEDDILPGMTADLSVLREPANANDTLIWTSSDESVATVINGRVTAKAAGRTQITALSAATAVSATITLDVVLPADDILFYDDMFADFDGYILSVGQKAAPEIKLMPEGAGGKVTFKSSDEEICAVSGYTIEALKKGECTVTVSSGNASKTLNITVVASKKSISSLKVKPSTMTMNQKSKKQIKATVNAGAYDKGVYYGSENVNVAKVSKKGKVTGVSEGVTYIRVMTRSGITKRVKVTVKPLMPKKVKLNKSKITAYSDSEIQLKALITPSGVSAKYAKVTWTSSNTNVALVDVNGVVHTMGIGSARIMAKTVNGLRAYCSVKVKPPPVKSITLNNPYGDFAVGGTYRLDAEVLPANATNAGIKWSLANAASKKLAVIDPKIGSIYCKKTGTITVKVTAADSSKKSAKIRINIVSVPITRFDVKLNGEIVNDGAKLTLSYGEEMTLTPEIEPAGLYCEWTTSDKRVAAVSKGVIKAAGVGAAKITVTAAGLQSKTFVINVPKDENAPAYRALVIGQYTRSSELSYLPFSANCTAGVKDALGCSSVNGLRYSISYATNIKSYSDLTGKISSTFSGAKDNDVSVIFLLSHGSMVSGEYRWHLYGKGTSSPHIKGAQLVSAISGIKGHVVLVVCSCYSGGDEGISTSVPGMIKALDSKRKTGSCSVLCANDGMTRSSYVKTVANRSYDFYSMGFCKSLGWNLVTDSEIDVKADSNKDGYVTLSELASSAKSLCRQEMDDYIRLYGSVGFVGNTAQSSTYYLSPKAKGLTVFMR